MRRILLATLLASGCIVHDAPRAPAMAETLPPAVGRLLDAFNRHDVEAMLRETHPDIEWFLVEGNAMSMEARGRHAFGESMSSYFASTPGVRSTPHGTVTNGRFVSVRERVHWTKKDGSEGTGASIAVYELEGGLVRRAWYFATEP